VLSDVMRIGVKRVNDSGCGKLGFGVNATFINPGGLFRYEEMESATRVSDPKRNGGY